MLVPSLVMRSPVMSKDPSLAAVTFPATAGKVTVPAFPLSSNSLHKESLIWLLAEERLDRQHQRVDVPVHSGTAPAENTGGEFLLNNSSYPPTLNNQFGRGTDLI